MDVVLKVDGLKRSFGDLKAVDDVSFTIGAGETYGLLGPNGAGKTTSISMIAGLLEPDAGTVLVSGEPMSTTATATKASLGLVPQDLAIYPDLTARENLTFFAKLYGISEDIKTRVEEVLEIIELKDRADDLAKEYSGGMKRRLNI
ncbi:MAG: ABC transporter ATP-binding protein, partial [Acidimicrobiia bacterium]|nr:ABC transporter ATP-binding protein [Acidimicrobiia bacterium]